MLWKRKAATAVAVIGVVLAVAGAAWPVWDELQAWRVLVLGAGAVSIVAILLQSRYSGATAVRCTSAAWTPVADGPTGLLEFRVPRKQHGRRQPNVSLYELTTSGDFEEVIPDVLTTAKGDVVLRSVLPVDGEIRIS